MFDSYAFFGRPRDGFTKQDFLKKLNLWTLFPSPEQLDDIFKEIDTDGSGKVSFTEFLAFFGCENSHHPLYANETAAFLPARTSGLGSRKPRAANGSSAALRAIARREAQTGTASQHVSKNWRGYHS